MESSEQKISNSEWSLEERVRDAFSDKDVSTYVNDYLSSLQNNLKDIGNNISKYALGYIFFICAFELLARAAISDVTLGPFKINDLSIIQRFLLVVISYLLLALFSSLSQKAEFETVHRIVLSEKYRSIVENELGDYLLPPTGSLPGEPVNMNYNLSETTSAILSAPFLILILIGPIVFEVYASYLLISIFGYGDILTWIVISVSVFLTLIAYIGMSTFLFKIASEDIRREKTILRDKT